MKSTSDIWFAAFLGVKNKKMAAFEKQGNKGKYTFEISEEEWSSLKLEFHNSIVSQIKSEQVKLKDLLY